MTSTRVSDELLAAARDVRQMANAGHIAPNNARAGRALDRLEAAFVTLASSPTGAAASDGEAVRDDGRFWLILKEPGCVPELKGSFRAHTMAATLREFIAARPTAYIDVLTIDALGPCVEHGPQTLEILDGRSMSISRKHNERTRAAHAEHHAALALATDEARP